MRFVWASCIYLDAFYARVIVLIVLNACVYILICICSHALSSILLMLVCLIVCVRTCFGYMELYVCYCGRACYLSGSCSASCYWPMCSLMLVAYTCCWSISCICVKSVLFDCTVINVEVADVLLL